MISALPLLLAPDGYQISRSLRFRASASAYFGRTLGTPTSGTTWTWSAWVKRGSLGSTQGLQHGYSASNNQGGIYFSGDALTVLDFPVATNCNLTTTQLFRDPSAWYHLIVQVDTTQATASNRVRVYVNGVQVTAFSTATYPAQNSVFRMIAAGNTGSVGRYFDGTSYYFDGYIAELNFVDGLALTPASFGQNDLVTGVWQPKKYTGAYGAAGFYLPFSDTTALAKDFSGRGNDWSVFNMTVSLDSVIDVPTPWADGGNGRGNYCVIDPIFAGANSISNANLTATYAAASTAYQQACTFSVSSGKWYYEGNLASFSVGSASNNLMAIGFWLRGSSQTEIQYGWISDGSVMRHSLRYIVNGTVQTRVNIDTTAFSSTDILGLAFDIDAGTLTAYKNGTQVAQITSITNAGDWTPMLRRDGTTNAATWNLNFGQRAFSYTPPTGFKALNTQNLPDSTIKAGNKFFDASLYTGTGAALTVTNSGSMQPDLVWLKSRSVGGTTANSHNLYDSVRGINAAGSPTLSTDQTIAEATYSGFGVSSLNSNGFSLIGNGSLSNTSGTNYVGWQWKRGATQGIDIVSGTSTGTSGTMTLAHSLGVAPSMIIAKNRDLADDWYTWHKDLGAASAGNAIRLNTTAAKFTSTNIWGTGPTSSNALFGQTNFFSASGQRLVAYLFAEVAGFSKFGSYTGNGSTDGPFVFCGFRPRFVMIKRTDAIGDWQSRDTARDPINGQNGNALNPNTSGAESATLGFDYVANGIKVRDTGGFNTSGATYIFAAFAENPFKYSLAR